MVEVRNVNFPHSKKLIDSKLVLDYKKMYTVYFRFKQKEKTNILRHRVWLMRCFVSPSCLCVQAIMSGCMCFKRPFFCLISESWCGLSVGNLGSNSCPPMALIVGMLEALSVPLPATRRGLYPGLLWGAPTVVRLSLLHGRAFCLGFEIPGYV